MFFSNGDICEEFVVDKHYVGPTCNHHASSICVAIDYYQGYMVLICATVQEMRSKLVGESIVGPHFCSN